MSNWKIIGDSCVDYIHGRGALPFVTRVPLSIELGDACFTDDGELDCDRLLDAMAQSKLPPKSACPSPSAFAEAIGDSDDAYIVTLSSKVSGTYSSALLGAQLASERKPRRNVHVFDSLSAAAGEVAVCLKLKECMDEGLCFERTVERVERYIREMTTLFALETLEVFRKNGRLSHLQALATAALNIKLVMGAEDGAIVARGKAFTMKRALDALVSIAAKGREGRSAEHNTVHITHCACLERAKALAQQLMERAGFGDAVICEARGISTMYANSGGVIVAF